jgi:hypothetical protein
MLSASQGYQEHLIPPQEGNGLSNGFGNRTLFTACQSHRMMGIQLPSVLV